MHHAGKLLAFPDILNAHVLVCENEQLKKELNTLKINYKPVGKSKT